MVVADSTGLMSTQAIPGGVTASNGLTATPGNVTLGGTLTTITTIANAGFNLAITGVGNVGIGVAVPTQKLEVSGDALINLVTVGRGSGNLNTNTTMGYQAFYNNTIGDSSAVFGFQALYSNTTGDKNTANGYQTLYANTSGAYNMASGFQALYSNTTADYNTALGSETLVFNTTGFANTATGAGALLSNTTAEYNTATGYTSLLSNTTGSSNTATGAGALFYNTTGRRNTAMGYDALFKNIAGEYNTAVGFVALHLHTTGNYNTAVGGNALLTPTSGTGNTALGYGTNVGSGLTNATAIGYNAVANASNKIRLGNASVTVIEGQVAYTYPSDGRFKYEIKENIPGLAFIKQLRPVSYHFDTKKYTAHLTQNRTDSSTHEKHEIPQEDYEVSRNIVHSGFIAQEIEIAAQNCGYDFDGLHKPDNETDTYSLAYSQFIMPMIKGMQEQQQMIEDLKAQNELLKADMQALKKQVEKLLKE